MTPPAGAPRRKPPAGRRIHLFVCLLTCILAARGTPAQPAPPASDLKAAFVSQFPLFVEWPDSALANRKTLDICVARPNPFGNALRMLTADESLRGRPLRVLDIGADEPLDTCHVLFVGGAASARRLIGRAADLPVLTIGESERFLDDGGIIRLHIVNRRVRFDINAAAADRAGLRLSAQLLQLAVAVRGRSE